MAQTNLEQSLPVAGGVHMQRLTGYSTEQTPAPLQLFGQSRTEQSSVKKGGAHWHWPKPARGERASERASEGVSEGAGRVGARRGDGAGGRAA